MWSAEELELRINQTVKWLQDRVQDAHAQGLVIGISGGVDSAVVAGLCKRAFPNNAIGVILPAESSAADIEDALFIAKKLSLKVVEIDLTHAHQNILASLKEVLTTEGYEFEEKLSQGNLKARLRMSTLYAVANALNYLVVGTDNAPEFYTGYFTKYGDGGVDILPIASLTKTEVRAWAFQLGFPERIAARVPSAGLWEGQTDEQEMGVAYDLIDRYLLGEKISEDIIDKIERMHHNSEHKRQVPPGLELPKLLNL